MNKFYSYMFNPDFLREILEKKDEFNNSGLFKDFLAELSNAENLNTEMKEAVTKMREILSMFYIADNLSFYDVFINKAFYTNKMMFMQHEEIEELNTIKNVLEVSSGYIELIPLWFLFGYPQVVEWLYSNVGSVAVSAVMGEELFRLRKYTPAELVKIRMDEELYEIYNFDETEHTLNLSKLRELIDLYLLFDDGN